MGRSPCFCFLWGEGDRIQRHKKELCSNQICTFWGPVKAGKLFSLEEEDGQRSRFQNSRPVQPTNGRARSWFEHSITGPPGASSASRQREPFPNKSPREASEDLGGFSCASREFSLRPALIKQTIPPSTPCLHLPAPPFHVLCCRITFSGTA